VSRSAHKAERIMANSKSAEKRVRQIEKRTDRNRSIKSEIKTLHKKTLAAAESGNNEEARTAFSAFASAVDKAAKRNVLKDNKAANMKSRTNKAIKPA
ncbi:30S ribosomal protein S20, partial [Akkermansiaceae bacterium]|nr:30S ribosomal protein S20 [Akkermansiaceae bacterium]